MKPMPSPAGRLTRALQHRNFRLFFGGQSISLVGTWITRVATSWLVYRLTGSALLLGVAGFAGQIPTLIIQGKQDDYGTDRQVNTLVSALGGRCEGIMLDQWGHTPHMDQRASVEDIMARFVRGL